MFGCFYFSDTEKKSDSLHSQCDTLAMLTEDSVSSERRAVAKNQADDFCNSGVETAVYTRNVFHQCVKWQSIKHLMTEKSKYPQGNYTISLAINHLPIHPSIHAYIHPSVYTSIANPSIATDGFLPLHCQQPELNRRRLRSRAINTTTCLRLSDYRGTRPLSPVAH